MKIFLKFKKTLWVLIIFILLGMSQIICEEMRGKAEDKLFNAHGNIMACLGKVSSERPSCAVGINEIPEDFDYCAEAVLVCKKMGFYHIAKQADDELAKWWQISIIFRAATLVSIILCVAWIVVRCCIAWRRKRSMQ